MTSRMVSSLMPSMNVGLSNALSSDCLNGQYHGMLSKRAVNLSLPPFTLLFVRYPSYTCRLLIDTQVSSPRFSFLSLTTMIHRIRHACHSNSTFAVRVMWQIPL